MREGIARQSGGERATVTTPGGGAWMENSERRGLGPKRESMLLLVIGLEWLEVGSAMQAWESEL